jgi:hypothetical protein
MYCATTNFRLAGTGTEVSRSSSIAVERSTQATIDSRRGLFLVSFAVKKIAEFCNRCFLHESVVNARWCDTMLVGLMQRSLVPQSYRCSRELSKMSRTKLCTSKW